MANFSTKFKPNFADMTEPLRRLTHKNSVIIWEEEHSKAFKQLKDVLTDSPVMTYFDVDKDTHLIVDANPKGISAILAQSNKDEPQKVIALHMPVEHLPQWSADTHKQKKRHLVLSGVQNIFTCIFLEKVSIWSQITNL